MDDSLLCVDAVVKEYGAQVRTRALGGIDLVVDRGEFLALTGPSGSGKSTLLNIIGLLDRPTSGRILLEGADTGGIDDRGLTSLRAHTLGFVFQFHHLLPEFTAIENVMLPAWGDEGFLSREMREQAEELLRAVGLAERMHFRTTNLSGGEQQRVAIARALSRRPPLVLADEPTGNLDEATADEVLALARDLVARTGCGFLMVTHSARLAAMLDRRINLHAGLIA